SDASATLANDGDNVLQWHDQSNSGNITTEAQITATTAITYVHGAVNFNPTVRFGGNDSQRLRGAAATDFAGASTIFFVARAETKPVDISGIFASVDDPTTSSRAGQGIYFANGSPSYHLDGPSAGGVDTANTTTAIGDNYRLVT